jgi:phospholipid:diacylglycerol acyltransferase
MPDDVLLASQSCGRTKAPKTLGTAAFKAISTRTVVADGATMNFLRRRNVGHESANGKPEGGDKPDEPETDGEFHIMGERRVAQLVKKPSGGKRRTAWIFGLGGIFGIGIAAFFVGNNDMLDLTMLQDLNLDSIMDVLPAGMLSEARSFQVS